MEGNDTNRLDFNNLLPIETDQSTDESSEGDAEGLHNPNNTENNSNSEDNLAGEPDSYDANDPDAGPFLYARSGSNPGSVRTLFEASVNSLNNSVRLNVSNRNRIGSDLYHLPPNFYEMLANNIHPSQLQISNVRDARFNPIESIGNPVGVAVNPAPAIINAIINPTNPVERPLNPGQGTANPGHGIANPGHGIANPGHDRANPDAQQASTEPQPGTSADIKQFNTSATAFGAPQTSANLENRPTAVCTLASIDAYLKDLTDLAIIDFKNLKIEEKKKASYETSSEGSLDGIKMGELRRRKIGRTNFKKKRSSSADTFPTHFDDESSSNEDDPSVSDGRRFSLDFNRDYDTRKRLVARRRLSRSLPDCHIEPICTNCEEREEEAEEEVLEGGDEPMEDEVPIEEED